MSAEAPLSLLTFAPMIDCETSRLVLAHYRIPYREEPHVFGWVSLLALWRAFTLRVPDLYGQGLRLASIVDHFDESCPVERKLIPARMPFHIQVEADWDLYNGELAAYTAVLAYFHLLPHRDIMLEPFFRGIPPGEKAILGGSYPLQSALLSLLLRLSPERARDALTHIRMIFKKTDARLRDGRRYLVGDTLTLADLSLAAAAAPLLLPEGYRAPIPPLQQMPPEMQAIVTELRQHETARFVQRIYAEQGAAA